MKFTPSTLHPLLKISIENQNVPFILGAPGIGKSAIMREIAKELDTKLFVVSANLLSDKADLTGVMKSTTPEGKVAQMFYPHQTIQEAIDFAEENPDKLTLLFLDEVNRSPEDVQTGLMSLSTERKIGNIDLPENISIILAGNDSGNVNSVDSATMSRSVVYRMVPSAKDLLASPAGLRFEPEIREWLKNNKDNIFSQPLETEDSTDDNNGSEIVDEMGEDFNQFTTPRTIEKLSQFMTAAKKTSLWKDLLESHDAHEQGITEGESELQGVIYAHIGHTAAAERLLTALMANSGSAAAVSLPTVPTSVKEVLVLDDVDEIIENLREQFVNDQELAERTLVGIFLRGATPAMEGFDMNVSAMPELIDMIFDVYGDAQAKLTTELSRLQVVSKLAYETLKDSSNANAQRFLMVIDALINGGMVQPIA